MGTTMSTRHIPWFMPKEDIPLWFNRNAFNQCRAIAPVFDFINHSNEPNADWNLTVTGMHVYALRDIEEGEEITTNYGIWAKTNSRSVAGYGFTGRNPNDVLEFSVSELE